MKEETNLKRAIIDAVNKSGLAKVWNSPAGVVRGGGGTRIHMAPRGTADVSGFQCRSGRAVFLEIKRPGQQPTPEQRAFIDDAIANGCIAGVVTSALQAIQLLWVQRV